ncbi:MAG TPA: hypothetical protein VGL83_13910 [Stellaceae bacterium]
MAFALALGGCHQLVDFSDWTQGYDLAADKARNESLLLNVVRSSYNEPLHFSTVAVVRGNGQITPSFSITAPFGASPIPTVRPTKSATIGASASEGFNFDVPTLDTSEFLKGILAPFPPDTVNYYIAEGLPRELIFNLMIHRITISDGKQTITYENNPTEDGYQGFRIALDTMLKLGFTTESTSSLIPFGPPLAAAEAKDTAKLAAAAQAGLILQPIGTGPNTSYQLVKPVKASRFCFMGAPGAQLPPAILCQSARGGASAPLPGSTADQDTFHVGPGFAGFENATLKIETRSTRDVFDYLGDLIWLQDDSPKPLHLNMETQEAKDYNYLPVGNELFVVHKNQSHSDDIVSIDYRGNTYSIPWANQGNSAIVLTILSQLITLGTSVGLIPETSSVVISGTNGH